MRRLLSFLCKRRKANISWRLAFLGAAAVICAGGLETANGQSRDISYAELARNPERYKDYTISVRGKVVQALEIGRSIALRVNITPGQYGVWSDTVYVDYQKKPAEQRILENDIVRVAGKFLGIKSYTAVLGQTIQIPHIEATNIEVAAGGRIGDQCPSGAPVIIRGGQRSC